ncbi:hypothetical protein [Halorussus aquaticus]|uniref:Uncharacterized protein n=1 Tax=Halorussus aquaticus TaxID=2953748 RepID=A0ABD5Q5X6_9EURY|nr:hypothetical protein [Halorussus aquaticus]
MDDELECHADGSFEYGDRDGYLDEVDGGTVGVDSDGSLVNLNVKVTEREEFVHARAKLTPEEAREVGEWLLDFADRTEE